MPNARTTDPITSVEAAMSVKNLSETKMKIIEILKTRGPSTDDQIYREFLNLMATGQASWASVSGVRSRRAELVKMGVIKESGDYTVTASGRRCIIWGLVNQ